MLTFDQNMAKYENENRNFYLRHCSKVSAPIHDAVVRPFCSQRQVQRILKRSGFYTGRLRESALQHIVEVVEVAINRIYASNCTVYFALF